MSNGNVPPSLPYKKSKPSPAAPKIRPISSDEAVVWALTVDYRDNPATDAADPVAWAHAATLMSYYNAAKGCSWPPYQKLEALENCSKSSVQRKNRRVQKNIMIKPGHNQTASEYYPIPEPHLTISQTIDKMADEGIPSLPTRINPEVGLTFSRVVRGRQIIAPEVRADSEYLIEGARELVEKYKDRELTVPDKLAMTGIRYNTQIAILLSMLPHESDAIRGISAKLGRHLNLKHGYFSVASSYFKDELNWKPRFTTNVMNGLIRSGWWRIDKDHRTQQSVLTLTPVMFAQLEAWVNQRKRKDPVTGRPGGFRPEFVLSIPEMPGIMAAQAEEFGINDMLAASEEVTEVNNARPHGIYFADRAVIEDEDGNELVLHFDRKSTKVPADQRYDKTAARNRQKGATSPTNFNSSWTPVNSPENTAADRNPYVEEI